MVPLAGATYFIPKFNVIYPKNEKIPIIMFTNKSKNVISFWPMIQQQIK